MRKERRVVENPEYMIIRERWQGGNVKGEASE